MKWKLEDGKTIKLKENIKFIKTCKRENLTPTFENGKLALKTGNTKLTPELQNNYIEQRETKEKLYRNLFREININFKSSLNIISYNVVMHQITIAIKSKVKSILSHHPNKLLKFRNRQTATEKISKIIT